MSTDTQAAPTGSDADVETSSGAHCHHGPAPVPAATHAGSTARDPVCGMLVDTATALRSDIGGRAFYFCSSGCQRTYDALDKERPIIAAAAMALSSLSVNTDSARPERLHMEHPS